MNYLRVTSLLLALGARIMAAQTVCTADATLDDRYGFIRYTYSEYYPTDWSWKVVVPAGSQVEIKFNDFQTTTCQTKPYCSCTWLDIKDGECSNSSLIGRYCGDNGPIRVESSTGRYLRLEFHSDGNTNVNNTFSAEYSTAMVCPYNSSSHSSSRYPKKCPNGKAHFSYNQCCHDNDTTDCCSYGGNICRGDGSALRNYCPRFHDDTSKTECCVAKGQPSCCYDGGMRCQGNGASKRDYCPRPFDDVDKNTCCVENEQPSCCYGGGSRCHGSGVDIRSYCPSLGRPKDEDVCCERDGKPSCCKLSNQACTRYLMMRHWNNAECIVIWTVTGIVGVITIIVVIITCYKWPFYHCLCHPFLECFPTLCERLARCFRFLLYWIWNWLRAVAYYFSLAVTTIVFTFGCWCCFLMNKKWPPWMEAYRVVIARFGDEKPKCCSVEEP